MKFAGSDIITIAIGLACCVQVAQRFASDRWRRRFGAIGSPMLGSSAHKVLFVLVVIGLLLIAFMPEAAFVLPAIDAVGLDIVTIFAALELRHYLVSVSRRIGTSTSVAVLRKQPALFLYACMWVLIWIKALSHSDTSHLSS